MQKLLSLRLLFCVVLRSCQQNTHSSERWNIHLTLPGPVCFQAWPSYSSTFFPDVFRSKEQCHFDVSDLMLWADDVLKCTTWISLLLWKQNPFPLQKSLPASLFPCRKNKKSFTPPSSVLCAEFSMMILSPCGPPSLLFWACSAEQMLLWILARGSCCCYELKTRLHCGALLQKVNTLFLCCSLTALRVEGTLSLLQCHGKC